MSRKSKLRLAASCAAALLISHSAYATDYAWNAAANANWNDNTKWTPTAGPGTTFPIAGDTATFNATGVNGAESIAMNAAEAAASLTFANTGTTAITHAAGQTLTLTNGFTVNNGAGAVTLGSSINNAFINLGGSSQSFINNDGAVAVTINGAITNAGNANAVVLTLDGTGTGGLQNLGTTSVANIADGGGGGAVSIVKSGTGTWQLNNNASSAANNFSGNVTINLGILKINGSNALGVTAKTLTLSGSSATLAAVGAARTITSLIGTSIGGNVTFGLTSGGQSLTLSGTVDLTGGNRSITANNNINFNGVVSNGSITKKGGSTLTLGNGANTFNGGATTILTGAIAAGAANVLPSPSANVLLIGNSSGTPTFNAAGFNQALSSLSDNGFSNGSVTMGNLAEGVLTTGSDNTNTVFSGVIAGNGNGNNAPPTSVGGLTKVGNGTFTISGLNTYNGVTTVTGGVLSANTLSNGGVSPSITTNITGGTANTAVVSSTAGLVIGMTIGNGNNIPLGTTITAINTGTSTITMSANATVASSTEGTIIGFANSLGLAANSAANLVLDGGTLQYTGAAVTTDRLFTMTTNGGTIDASGASNAALNLAGNGANLIALTGSGTRTLTLTGNSTGANTLAPILGDSGGATSLTKTGTGTWVLSGANTYTGGTAVSAGNLLITQDLRKSASLTVADSAKTVMTARVANVRKVMQVGTLNLNTSGTLDLNDNDLVVDNGVFSDIQAKVFSGYGTTPDTNLTGITSTVGQNTGGVAILALFNNALFGVTDYPFGSGQTIGANAIVGKYTYIGDTDWNGEVNSQDYTAVDANLGTTGIDLGAAWFSGDTNFDGNIDPNDYTGIDAALGLGAGNPLSAQGLAAVPEPASIGLVFAAAAGMLSRRRRK